MLYFFSTAGPVPWSHFPPPGAVLITGVNRLLDGSTPGSDSFLLAPASLVNADGTNIIVKTAPEPAVVLLLGVSAMSLAARAQRRRRRR